MARSSITPQASVVPRTTVVALKLLAFGKIVIVYLKLENGAGQMRAITFIIG